MDKIAVHVPNKWLGEAVQKYLFSKSWTWGGGVNTVRTNIFDRSREGLGISLAEDFSKDQLEFDVISHYETRGYTILTVDEFFAREAEKPLTELTLDQDVQTLRVSIRGDNIIFSQSGSCIAIDWQEYDEIGKLRPKE